MLKKIFKSVFEQPYRYLTLSGDVYDKPFMQRFHHRAEIKATAAGLAGIALFVNKSLGIPFSEAPLFLVGGLLGYVSDRRMFGVMSDMFLEMRFQRMPVVDTKPDKNMMTSPEDLQKCIYELEYNKNTIKEYGLGVAFRAACTTALVVVVNNQIDDPLIRAVPIFMQGYALAFDLGSLFRKTSTVSRMNRIISGEYVVLSEPPEKQEMRHKISLELPEASPAPQPSGA